MCFMLDGDIPGALFHINGVIPKFHSDYACEVYCMRAACYMALGRYKECLKDLSCFQDNNKLGLTDLLHIIIMAIIMHYITNLAPIFFFCDRSWMLFKLKIDLIMLG